MEACSPHTFPSAVHVLNSSSEAFKSNDRERGFKEFQYVPTAFQNNVYEQLWINRGQPQGNLFYGQHSFHDQYNHSSTLPEKAEAIDKFVASIQKQQAYKERSISESQQHLSTYETNETSSETNQHMMIAGCVQSRSRDMTWYPYTSHYDWYRGNQQAADANDRLHRSPKDFENLFPQNGDSPAQRDGKIAAAVITVIGTAALFAVYLARNH